MAELNSDSTGKRVRRIGVATLALLCSLIAMSLVGYFVLPSDIPAMSISLELA